MTWVAVHIGLAVKPSLGAAAACLRSSISTVAVIPADRTMPGSEHLILAASICIPCMMPFITSQFLRREKGDRPQVVPKGSKNLAFAGQVCELPDDVVFTVEYSIRSALTAIYTLLGPKREPPAVYRGESDPRVLYKAFMALHDFAA